MKKGRSGSENQSQMQSLLQELRRYEREGMQFSLDGRPCGKEAIVRACTVAEEQTYMRDYISDEKEQIRRINFVRVRDK